MTRYRVRCDLTVEAECEADAAELAGQLVTYWDLRERGKLHGVDDDTGTISVEEVKE